MKEKKIGIVTVLYNSETVLDDFFSTLALQSYKTFVLYIVDNKSPDNSLAKAKELASQNDFETVFIENPQNDGVAKGNNLGIEKALADGCDYVLLSNNDVVLYEDTIKNLLFATEHNNVLVTVPKILIYDNKNIWFAGGELNFRTFRVKQDEENEMNYMRTTRYNKLKICKNNKSMFSPKSQSNINNKNDFPMMSRNRIESSNKNDIVNENQSSQINKNFNVLFDYFMQ